MAKRQRETERSIVEINPVDGLRLRVSAMINSPKAQAECRVSIWRLDRDTDQAWAQVMEELSETDGLKMVQNEDGTITLQWEAMAEEGATVVAEELGVLQEMVVQVLHDESAPF